MAFAGNTIAEDQFPLNNDSRELIEEKSQNRMACSDRLGKKRCDKLFHDNKCKGVNEDKMSYNCAKTCKKCSKLQNIMTCSDRLGSERCITYTNNGMLCNGLYKGKMTYNCKKTCNKC